MSYYHIDACLSWPIALTWCEHRTALGFRGSALFPARHGKNRYSWMPVRAPGKFLRFFLPLLVDSGWISRTRLSTSASEKGKCLFASRCGIDRLASRFRDDRPASGFTNERAVSRARLLVPLSPRLPSPPSTWTRRESATNYFRCPWRGP